MAATDKDLKDFEDLVKKEIPAVVDLDVKGTLYDYLFDRCMHLE